MKILWHVFITSTFAGALFLTGCSQNETSQGATGFPRNQTLYVGGFQWGPPTSFNPLAITPAWPSTGNMNLIYESMFGYNQLTGEIEPVLAESYRFEGDKLHVTLDSLAAWQDGSALTARDVVYTFMLHKKYSTLFHSHWNYIDAIESPSVREIVFTLSGKNYNPLVLRDIISVTFILPKKVFEPLEKKGVDAGLSEAEILTGIREYKADSLPMGSGPYTLHAFSDQKIVLKRAENYWGDARHGGKSAAPLYLVHVAYSSNDKFNLALQQGDLDISQTFCPQIWNKFDKGVGTWHKKEPYYIPAIIPSLLMSLTKEPFDDPALRRALAHAINYDQIRRLAVYSYTPPLKPGFILPFGTESQYYSEEDAKKHGYGYDPEKAREILLKAGYGWGEDSLLIAPNGHKIRTLFVTCPSGWTDWETTVKIAVTGIRAIGLDAREKFEEYPVWDKNLKNGLFDMTMRTPHPELSPSCPWSRFEKVMSSKEWAPVGEVMYENEGRYRSAKADSLLRMIPTIADSAARVAAYRALNTLFMQDIPVLPLMYRPWHFYQFSTKVWDNFPTGENPYAPPQCLMVGAGVKALWELTSAR
jgi:peptide/nickel transport system substrate-binding protein